MKKPTPNEEFWNLSIPHWRYYFSNYEEALRIKNKDLVALDRLIWNDLPKSIHARDEPYTNTDEYRQVVSWKLMRGKNRPNLLNFAKALDNDSVIKASKNAFSNLNGNHTVPMNHLTVLKGCGPATASALLAVVDSSYPFMSDELLSLTLGHVTYNKAAYDMMITLVREKSKTLSAEELEGRIWTPRDVEKVAFAYKNGIEPPSDEELHSHSVVRRDSMSKDYSAKNSLNNDGETLVANRNPQVGNRSKPLILRTKRQRQSVHCGDEDTNASQVSVATDAEQLPELRHGKSNQGVAANLSANKKAKRSSAQVISSKADKTDNAIKKMTTRGKGRMQVQVKHNLADAGSNGKLDDTIKDTSNDLADGNYICHVPINKTSNKGRSRRKFASASGNQIKQSPRKNEIESKNCPKLTSTNCEAKAVKWSGSSHNGVNTAIKVEESNAVNFASETGASVTTDANAQNGSNLEEKRSVMAQQSRAAEDLGPVLRRSKRVKPPYVR